MSTATKLLTPQEFLRREAVATQKHEFYQGEVLAMAGGSPAHNRIASNVHWRLGQQLDGKPCQVNQSDVMIKVETTGLHTYPDVSVNCPPVQREDAPIEVLLNPRVIVEVLSPSTAQYDRSTKFRHYLRIESLQEILLIEQDEAVVEHFRRQADGTWALTTLEGMSSKVVLPTIGCELTLSQIYDRVEFPPPTVHPTPQPPGAPSGQ